MSGGITSSLNIGSLILWLQECRSPHKAKGHLCIHTKVKTYKVFEGTKLASEIQSQGYRPVSLREIVLFGKKHRSEFVADAKSAHEMASILEQMRLEKAVKARKTCCLKRLVCSILECAYNFFKGLGFRSTSSAAKHLVSDLSNIFFKKQSSEFEGFIRQPTTLDIPANERFKSYGTYVTQCLENDSEPVLSQLVITHVLVSAKKAPFEFMRTVSGVEWYDPMQKRGYVDFSQPKVFCVMRDLIARGDNHFISTFLDQLKKHPTFNADGIKACLKGYIERLDRQRCDLNFICEVLKYYRNFIGSKKLPLNDPTIIEAMGVLLAKAFEEEAAYHLLNWYTKDSSFNYDIAITLIEAFKSAGRVFSAVGANLGLVTRIFNEQNTLKQRFQEEKPELFSLVFPPPQEARPYEPPPTVSTEIGRESSRYSTMRLKRLLTQVLERREVKVGKIPAKCSEWLKTYAGYIEAKVEGREVTLPKTANNLFLNLHPQLEHENPNDFIHSVKGLILAISNVEVVDTLDPANLLEYVDFEDAKAVQVFMDMLSHAKEAQIAQLWNWVDTNPTFGLFAIQRCFEALPTLLVKKNNSFFLECFKKYRSHYGKFAPELPLYSPIVYKALASLISFNTIEVKELINWYVEYFTDYKKHFTENHLKDVSGLLKLVVERPEYRHLLNFVDETSVYAAKEIEQAYREKYNRKIAWFLRYHDNGSPVASLEEQDFISQSIGNLRSDSATEALIIEGWKKWIKNFSHEPSLFIIENFSRDIKANKALLDLFKLGINCSQQTSTDLV